MGLFEKFLSVWVGLAIILGMVAGHVIPEFFATVATWEYAHVNLLVAVLIWVMIYRMMIQVDFS